MYKKSLVLMLSAMLLMGIFSGCMNKNKEAEENDGHRVSSAILEESSGEGTIVESSTEDFIEESKEEESVPSDEEANADINEEENVSSDISTGITPHESDIYLEDNVKTPVITVENGITYVDRILIANKTYPLPADYDPGDLLPEVYEAFYKLQAGAREDGLSIYISSGYRDYDLQSRLYQNYCARDGQAAADRYSARPGHSEHQSGLGLDVNEISDRFIGTPEAIWLADHAHEYGFIIRYMQGKEEITGYKYEPWHLRYLGEDLAKDVYESGLCLEEYLGIDSEYKD